MHTIIYFTFLHLHIYLQMYKHIIVLYVSPPSLYTHTCTYMYTHTYTQIFLCTAQVFKFEKLMTYLICILMFLLSCFFILLFVSLLIYGLLIAFVFMAICTISSFYCKYLFLFLEDIYLRYTTGFLHKYISKIYIIFIYNI